MKLFIKLKGDFKIVYLNLIIIGLCSTFQGQTQSLSWGSIGALRFSLMIDFSLNDKSPAESTDKEFMLCVLEMDSFGVVKKYDIIADKINTGRISEMLKAFRFDRFRLNPLPGSWKKKIILPFICTYPKTTDEYHDQGLKMWKQYASPVVFENDSFILLRPYEYRKPPPSYDYGCYFVIKNEHFEKTIKRSYFDSADLNLLHSAIHNYMFRHSSKNSVYRSSGMVSCFADIDSAGKISKIRFYGIQMGEEISYKLIKNISVKAFKNYTFPSCRGTTVSIPIVNDPPLFLPDNGKLITKKKETNDLIPIKNHLDVLNLNGGQQ